MYNITQINMADTGPPALPVHPAVPVPQVPKALQLPVQLVQLPVAPDQLVPAQPIQHIPQLHWSEIKPEFTGIPKEDAETDLLVTNDCMDTHAFPEGVKVQWFSLTLVEEARL